MPIDCRLVAKIRSSEQARSNALIPAAGRAIDTRAEVAADQLVFELALGGVLAGLLRRYGHPMTLERLQRLEAATEPTQRPRLHLVHG